MIKIFTAFQEKPLHPRLEMQLKWFAANGKEAKVYFDNTGAGRWANFRNRLVLKFFRLDLIRKYKHQLHDCSVVHIYDFRLLPLARYAKKAGKKVVYETLDDNVHLTYYTLEKKGWLFRKLKPFIVNRISGKEQKLITNYCDEFIVNSPNLLKLSPKATLIYYASPFENVHLDPFDRNKPFAFLYLGKLTVSKGTKQYEQLINTYRLPFHFYGQAKDAYSINWLAQCRESVQHGNLGSEELKESLVSLSRQFNLIGLSIIIPENESYALQEANKDIDYMCLQIPFIGNERVPTFEKIKSGAGILNTDLDAISRLINNEQNMYLQVQSVQSKLYEEKYATVNFYRLFAKVYAKLNQNP